MKMITGDHAGTAAAIARSARPGQPADSVKTGRDLDHVDDQALVDIAAEADVYARTSPQHKLRLVEALAGRAI